MSKRERLRGSIVRNLMWKKAPYYMLDYYDGKMICPPSFAKWIARPDVWEPESRRYLEEHVKPDDIAIDIGAGVGHYTLLFSHLVGSGGLVYAYEPDPFMFKILVANIKLNDIKNVVVGRYAISDRNDKMPFYISTVGSSSLLPMRGLRSIIKVKTLTIDSLNLSALDWVKIDTEGHEANVLKGMRKTIEKHRPRLLVEFIPENGPVDGLLCEIDGWDVLGLDNNILCQLPKKGR